MVELLVQTFICETSVRQIDLLDWLFNHPMQYPNKDELLQILMQANLKTNSLLISRVEVMEQLVIDKYMYYAKSPGSSSCLNST